MEKYKSQIECEPFFSIIIPMYNSEKYIEETIHSILEQRYENFEIIVVDDGSTDNSLKKVRDISELDARIKIYHKLNGGVASARNYGILNAKGVYLCFLDADDLLGGENALFDAHQALYDHNIDLAVCNSYGEMTHSGYVENILFGEKIFQIKERKAIKVLCQNLSSMCIGIYLREFILKENLRVKEGVKCAEDTDFFFRTLVKSKNPAIIKCKLFLYRYNEGSVSNSLSYKNIKDVLSICSEQMKNLIESPNDEIDTLKALNFFVTKFIHFGIKTAKLRGKERTELVELMMQNRKFLKYAKAKPDRLYARCVKLCGENLSIIIFEFLIRMRNRMKGSSV